MTTNPQEDATGNDRNVLSLYNLSRTELERLANGTLKDRQEALQRKRASSDNALDPPRLSFLEELACVLVLGLGVPNGVFLIPPLTAAIGWLCGNISLAFQILGILLLPLAFLPQPEIPTLAHSWIAQQLYRYFSMQLVIQDIQSLHSIQPRIAAASPHGVFPYGNLLLVLGWRLWAGHAIVGLASSAALRPPLFRQELQAMGVQNASRETCRAALAQNATVGINPGGVAEVFVCCLEESTEERIVLQSRRGIIRMALQHGADLVPIYVFGNNQVYRGWSGQGVPGLVALNEFVSRKFLGTALLWIVGRWGLPIPKRVPLLAVIGKPIRTARVEHPTDEQIRKHHETFMAAVQALFDEYKEMYGWKDKKLVIL